MKKILGFFFLAIGIGVLLFVIYAFIRNRNGFVSPVPDSGDVKVIYITPGSASK